MALCLVAQVHKTVALVGLCSHMIDAYFHMCAELYFHEEEERLCAVRFGSAQM